jgi:hypothetical protein
MCVAAKLKERLTEAMKKHLEPSLPAPDKAAPEKVAPSKSAADAGGEGAGSASILKRVKLVRIDPTRLVSQQLICCAPSFCTLTSLQAAKRSMYMRAMASVREAWIAEEKARLTLSLTPLMEAEGEGVPPPTDEGMILPETSPPQVACNDRLSEASGQAALPHVLPSAEDPAHADDCDPEVSALEAAQEEVDLRAAAEAAAAEAAAAAGAEACTGTGKSMQRVKSAVKGAKDSSSRSLTNLTSIGGLLGDGGLKRLGEGGGGFAAARLRARRSLGTLMMALAEDRVSD